jgi:hypothetical protein
MEHNARKLVDDVLQGGSFSRKDITVLCQDQCTISTVKDPSNPGKPIILKNLDVYRKVANLENADNVLLIDDTPLKNVFNDAYNAVHPQPWAGDAKDTSLRDVFMPWLQALFSSYISVPDFVRTNPFPCGSPPLDKLSTLAFQVIQAANKR